MKCDISKKKGKSAQPNGDLGKKHKGVIRRTAAFVIAAAVMTTGLPMQQIADNLPKLDIISKISSLLPDSAINAAAEDAGYRTEAKNVSIASGGDLVAYVKGTLTDSSGELVGYNENDTLTITLRENLYPLQNFEGIGTKDHPFAGKVIIGIVTDTDPYGEFTKLRWENSSFFNYVTTDAIITNVNENDKEKPVYFKIDAAGTAPLFAKHVINGSNTRPQPWYIVVDASAKYGGIVGDLGEGAKADMHIGYLANSSVSGGDTAGGICGTMQKNSALSLSINEKIKDIKGAEMTSCSLGSVSANKFAGGVIGQMNAGAVLTINEMPEITGDRDITVTKGNDTERNAAGGLIGKLNAGAKVELADNVTYVDSAGGNIKVAEAPKLSSAGGVFGYYGVAEGDTVDIDVSRYKVSGNKTLTANADGGFIGRIMLSGKDNSGKAATVTIDGKTPKTKDSDTDFEITTNLGTAGGVVGKIFSDEKECLENTVIIKNVKTDITANNGNGGGIVGDLGYYQKIKGRTYLKIDGTNYIDVKPSTNSSGSGGIAFSVYSSFLDIGGENTIIGDVDAGVVDKVVDYDNYGSVVRFSGKTDISGAKVKTALLVNLQTDGGTGTDDGLIYALGSGSDYDSAAKKGWTYIRPSDKDTKKEDVSPWGEVIRLIDGKTIEEAGVVEYDKIAHTVTLKGIAAENNEYKIANTADLMKLALCIQHNTAAKSGAFTTGGCDTSANILKRNITLTGDADLRGTGLRGLTRDDGVNNEFTGKLNGGGNKITLAIGEAYGYRGEALAKNTEDGSNGNTGAVYSHKYQGLFAKISGATIKDLTLDGSICIEANTDDIYCGAAAAQFSGNTKAENVKSDVNIIMRKGEQRIDIGTIFGVDSAENTTVTLKNCTSNFDMTLAGKANSSYNGVSAGTIGHVKNSGSNVTVNGMTINGKLANSIALKKDGDKTYYFYGYGGLIGVVEHQSTKHKIELNDVNVSNFNITDNSDNNAAGGLLGGSWNNVNVTIGDNSTHDKGVTVDGSKITVEKSASKTIGGLVTSSYGYWQVNSLKYTSSSITDSSSSVVGLIVGKGYEDRTLPNTTETDNTPINNAVEPKRLYLEITDPSAYDCSGMTYKGSANTYDEIVGRTMKERDDDDIGASGEGIVSIRTSGDKLNMDSSNSNEYKPQTVFGKTADANPYTRYYYNLDYLRAKASHTGGEKAVLWSAYTYAAKNIREYFKDYSTFPTDKEIDLAGLSYYPVDVDLSVSLSGANVKLYNEQIQKAHGTNFSTWAYSQHYLMQCGLFRDVTASAELKDCTFSGTAAAYRKSPSTASSDFDVRGSGAIICGALYGTAEQKASLSIDGVTFDGLRICNLNSENYNTANMALAVRSIRGYSETNFSGASAKNYADNAKAAWSLIGIAGSSDVQQMTIRFSDMRLDGRSAANNVSANAQSVFKEKYSTASSIFTRATFIDTLWYNSEGSGSSAVYNYNYNEDWADDGSAKHNVTYGKEISHSAEFAPDAGDNDQRRYLDKHATADEEHYTSPESASAKATAATSTSGVYGGFDFSKFLPYVATGYDASKQYHELAVNHVSNEMGEGCGTYNDPFIIDDGTTLSMAADIISSGNVSKGFSMYIDNDYLSSKDINFEKWDSDKAGGKNHTRIGFNGSKFVAMKKDGDEWTEDKDTEISISINEVRAYLAGAYYLVEGSDENGGIITLSEKFVGLGQTGSDYSFRGVIAGKEYNGKKMVIENSSDKPLVSVSNGCVIKDLDIKVTASNIKLTNEKNSKNGQLSYSDGTPVYGAVIGKILGGDTVIDAVSAEFSNTKIQLITSNNSDYYKYTALIPVGGYVGAAVNGGLVFRNMGSEKISPLSNVTFEVYKNTSTQTSDKMENYFYVNQIVGRVVNAYCFNEAESYSIESKVLDNGENNYPIPDLDADSKDKISFTQEDGKTVKTMLVPDSQSLFILSEITQSMCGNASSAGGYNVKNSYGEYNKTTHLAKYSAVGTDDAQQPKDFELAKNDSSGKENALPYIIRQYTAADTNGKYPARAITGSSNYHYMKLAENAKYDLPKCFRGIGQLYPQEMSDSDICKNILALYGLDGNGSTINLNTEFKSYSSEWDCYYKDSNPSITESTKNADKIGLGLFNDLYFDVKAKTDDGRKEKSNSIHDLTLSGTLTQEQFDNNKKITMTASTPLAANTGGIIGSLRYTASDIDNNSCEYNFWNVSLDDLTISGERATGGFIGYVPEKSLSIYLNECSANKLKVNGTLFAVGGVIGYMLGNANLYINSLTDETSKFNESVTSDNTTNNVDTNCGGIIGQLGNITANANSEVIIRNVTVTATNGHIGNKKSEANSAFNGVGGAIGLANAEGSNEKIKILLINFNLDKVNMYGKNVGGLIGNAKNKLIVRAYNCHIAGGSNTFSGIDHVGGLFGYFPASGTGTVEFNKNTYSNHIDGCSVSGYTISATSGAGGLIGTNNDSRKICNSKVENCTIKGGSSTGTGGIIGSCGANVNAYNIVVNGVTLSGSSSYYGLFSGYSKEKTFNIVGWSVQGNNTKADKIFSGTDNIATVIPADYNGACLDESTRGKNLSDITTADNISRVNKSDDNFPYATSSPAKNVGTGAKFLTGDGTSAEAVEKIIADREDTTNLKHYTIKEDDIANYKKLTFSTEQDILKDIPVILIDDTVDISKQVNSYLSILTNGQVSKANDVKVYKANISGDKAELSESGQTVSTQLDANKNFTKFEAKSDKFDTDTRGQFTLIDVQYTDPTVISNAKVVYHVYVPVMTRKIYQYEFFTTAFSGTQYYPSKYTDEKGNNGFNGSDAKVLIENYDTPITAYLRWAYPSDTFISDIMGGSSGLDWNYEKVLSLNVNYGGTANTIPKGTQLVLIDKNNKNKEYYYTMTGNEEYSGTKLELPFSEFTDSNGKAFGKSEADFADMVNSQLDLKKTESESGLFVEDENGNMTVKIDGKKTTIRPAADGDTACFDLSTDTKYLTEDYYLTMITTKSEENVLFHQFQVTSASMLYPNKSGKINGALATIHSVQLNFADLFSNTIEVETLESNTNVEMTDENNAVSISTLSTIKFNTTNTTTISNLKTLLTTNNISIYHSSHVFMNKRSTNHGAAEKMIGDIDGIEMIKGADTIAAYDDTGAELASPSKLEYDMVSGKASANFFEVSERNGEAVIDIRPWLTAGEMGVAPVVKIKTSFKIIYTHSGIVAQFPERQKSEETTDIGTYVSARSSLAYDVADTTYSSSVSDTVKDSKNCLYYRNAMNDASLKFNAYHPESTSAPDEDRGDGQTKANDQLGINVFDEETETSSLIHTKGIFDASQLSALDKKNLNIRWTIELQSKNDSYNDDLKLPDYLNSVTVKNVDENQLAAFSADDLSGTKLAYSAKREEFEEPNNAGLFDVYIDLDVKTGTDLEAAENAFYSNYKIVLTASLYEGSTIIDGSTADDYIIYTNAHLDPKFIDKAS